MVQDAPQEVSNSPVKEATGRFAASWSVVLTVGLVTMLLGILIVAWPDVTVGVLAVLFGVQLLLYGIFNIVKSFAAANAGGVERVLFAFLGLLSIAVGVLALRHLLQTVEVLAILFGLTWLIGGIIEFVNLMNAPSRPGRGWAIASAVLATLAGIVVLAYPTPSLVTLTILIGIWLVFWGAITAILAFAARSAANR